MQATAARWLVLDDEGDVRAVDVVGELLALDPRTKLQSREGKLLRAIAAAVDQLVGLDAVCASGEPLLEVLVPDPEDRGKLTPSLDLDALLRGDAPESRTADRTIRLAGLLSARAAAHRAGEVDLVAAVAPPGPGRHPLADRVEAALPGSMGTWPRPAGPTPAVVTLDGGWVGASPFELFVGLARGAFDEAIVEVAGEAVARWLDRWSLGPDPWRQALRDIVPVDADGLLHDAATRAGSDHPVVVAGPLAQLVRSQHPMA